MRRTMAAHVFAALEILEKGLLAVKFDQRQLDRVGLKKNLSRFRSNYVGHPRVHVILFEMLQETGLLDCSILGLEMISLSQLCVVKVESGASVLRIVDIVFFGFMAGL